MTSEPAADQRAVVTLAWWGAWTVLLITLIGFNLSH
jgi:hypothetical protein